MSGFTPQGQEQLWRVERERDKVLPILICRYPSLWSGGPRSRNQLCLYGQRPHQQVGTQQETTNAQ